MVVLLQSKVETRTAPEQRRGVSFGRLDRRDAHNQSESEATLLELELVDSLQELLLLLPLLSAAGTGLAFVAALFAALGLALLDPFGLALALLCRLAMA